MTASSILELINAAGLLSAASSSFDVPPPKRARVNARADWSPQTVVLWEMFSRKLSSAELPDVEGKFFCLLAVRDPQHNSVLSSPRSAHLLV